MKLNKTKKKANKPNNVFLGGGSLSFLPSNSLVIRIKLTVFLEYLVCSNLQNHIPF